MTHGLLAMEELDGRLEEQRCPEGWGESCWLRVERACLKIRPRETVYFHIIQHVFYEREQWERHMPCRLLREAKLSLWSVHVRSAAPQVVERVWGTNH